MKILPFKIILIIALFLPFFIEGSKIPMDSSEVIFKDIDSIRIKVYQTNNDFLYDRVPPPAEDWWEALKRMFGDWFGELFEQSGIAFTWNYLKWLLLVIGIGFIVLRIFKN